MRSVTLLVCEGEGGGRCGLEDLEDFVNLGVAGEQGLPRAHLGEDAADGPHVDAGRVLSAAEEDLRGAVPECHHLGSAISLLMLTPGVELRRSGYFMSISPQRHAKGSRQPKVR